MEILIVFFLIAINGIFALAEISFVSSRRELIEEAATQGNKSASTVLSMMETPDRFLSVIQVGITLIGIISGTFSGIAISDDLAKILKPIPYINMYADTIALVAVVSFVTYFSIVFGELFPKTIGLKNPEKFILGLIKPVYFFSMIMNPIVSFLSMSTKLLMKMFGIKPGSIDEGSDPIKEILGIAKMAAIKNKIDGVQEKIINNAIKTRKLTVKDIMVSKSEMRTLTTDMSLPDALIAAHVHHHTRYPLIDNDGSVIGYINFKDIINMLRLNPQSPTLIGIKRPITSINEKEKVTDALRNLIRTHQHIAMVKNDHGQISGLITLENTLETIVGDITDEYDVPPEYLYDINETRLLAGGGIQMNILRDRLGPVIPDVNKTICQWLLDTAPKPLKVENRFTFHGIQFEIRKMSRSKISEIIIDFSEIEKTPEQDNQPSEISH